MRREIYGYFGSLFFAEGFVFLMGLLLLREAVPYILAWIVGVTLLFLIGICIASGGNASSWHYIALFVAGIVFTIIMICVAWNGIFGDGRVVVKDVNPFKHAEVEFDGVDVATVHVLPDELMSDAYVEFVPDKETVREGDVVTVTVKYNDQTARNAGCNIIKTSKAYTCPRLDHWLTSWDELNKEAAGRVVNTARGVLEAVLKDNGDGDWLSVSDIRYEGSYVLRLKKGSEDTIHGFERNYLDVVFSASVKGLYSHRSERKMYFVLETGNVILKDDDSIEYKGINGKTNPAFEILAPYDSNNDELEYATTADGGWDWLPAFLDLETLKKELTVDNGREEIGKHYESSASGDVL